MSQKKIKLFSTTGKIKNGDLDNVSSADDLRQRFKDLKIDLSGSKVLNAKTDEEYNINTMQELPEGDLQLYILPAKTKSGNS